MKGGAGGNRLYEGRICALLAERPFVCGLRMTVFALRSLVDVWVGRAWADTNPPLQDWLGSVATRSLRFSKGGRVVRILAPSPLAGEGRGEGLRADAIRPSCMVREQFANRAEQAPPLRV